MRARSLITAAALLLAAMFASRASGAPYVLTTSAPLQTTGPIFCDTLITTTLGSVDTLMFGGGCDQAVVWTDAAETVTAKWVGTNTTTLLKQRGGTAPPAAAAAKARYGSKVFSSVAYTVPASCEYWFPYLRKAVKGVILTGTGSYVINVRAWAE